MPTNGKLAFHFFFIINNIFNTVIVSDRYSFGQVKNTTMFRLQCYLQGEDLFSQIPPACERYIIANSVQELLQFWFPIPSRDHSC